MRRMREKLLTSRTISSLLQVGYNSFPEMNSKIAQACAFSVISTHVQNFTGNYIDLNSAPQSADKNQIFLERTKELVHDVCQDDFKKISGGPLAYWVSEKVFVCFETNRNIADLAETKSGMSTTDNLQFLRYWQEVSWGTIGLGFENAREAEVSNRKWFPYSKGGEFRKWYGNQEYVVNWKADGKDIRACIASDPAKQVGGRIVNEDYYFKAGVGWSDLTSGRLSARLQNKGFLFDSVNPVAFPHSQDDTSLLLAFLNCDFANYLSKILNPTLHFTPGNARELPVPNKTQMLQRPHTVCDRCISFARADWDNFETSWDFIENPLIRQKQISDIGWVSDSVNQQIEATNVGLRDKAANPTYASTTSLEQAFNQWQTQSRTAIVEMQRLEEENNRLFIEAYGLQDELSPEVPEAPNHPRPCRPRKRLPATDFLCHRLHDGPLQPG